MLQHPKRILSTLLLFFTVINAYSQATCPANIDFERGNFSGWNCSGGTVNFTNGRNVITWTGTGQIAGRHTLIPSTNSSLDPYGNFPVRCPNGSGFSVKLGNDNTGQEAEALSYVYTIPATVTDFSLLYQYAVVFQDPGDHAPPEQPRFQARITNLTDSIVIDCVSFDFTANAALPGFRVSPLDNLVLYKDWTPVTLDLHLYAGKTIKVEFITSDCTRGGHFGYAYVDVNSSCNGSIIGSTICVGDPFVSLTAPYGFQTYAWYADNTFSQIIGTSQVLTINPAPTIGSIIPVIVTPFPGFGCIDTVFSTITTSPKPISNAGPDRASCKYQQVPIGTIPNSSYAYTWTPSNLVTNPSIANPSGFAASFTPVELIVKTVEINTGCFSYDTVKIVPTILDTSITISGPAAYCTGKPLNTVLTMNTPPDAIQWFNINTSVPSATNNSFSPVTTGVYWAQISKFGCTDSSQKIRFTINPAPILFFSVNKDTQCVTKNSFTFKNTTSITDNSLLSYVWKFDDGSVSQAANPVKNYLTRGNFNVKLITTSSNGCTDSLSIPVYIMPNISPDFKWDSVCTNRDVHFTNLTTTNGSSAVKYLWDFDNGSVSVLKDPQPFTYPIGGKYNVSLTATALGCETDPRVTRYPVNANKVMPGIRYPDKTIGEGYTSIIWARESRGNFYAWKPGTQLNKTTTRAPSFFALNDVNYEISLEDKNTCITVDTLRMFVLKKKGGYLPNAFTPNGDGLNDVLHPYIIGMKALNKFTVYNRWGNIIFTTAVNGKGWDGTFKGVKLDSDSFVWLLEYVDTTDKIITQKGVVMLIR